MTLEEMLQQYLAAELAKNAPKPAEQPVEAHKGVSEERVVELLNGLAEHLSKGIEAKLTEVQTAVAEQVEKALPVREPGAGRAGVEQGPEEGSIESDPVAYLARKARTDEGLSQEEKDLAWALTKQVITDGMVY